MSNEARKTAILCRVVRKHCLSLGIRLGEKPVIKRQRKKVRKH